MVGRVTPNSVAICATVCAFALVVGRVVHLPGQGYLAGAEFGFLAAGAPADARAAGPSR